ncbi:MAG: aminoglycoside phosphotransferase family protein [Rhodoglobus sp.]
MRSVGFEDAALTTYPTRLLWDAAAGDLVASMLARWHLIAGEPYRHGESGAVLRVTTSDGRPAVLKVGFPHWEGRWEAVALEFWGGQFAPEVLKQDAWAWAMLLERAEPGEPLSRLQASTKHALEIAARLYTEAVIARSASTIPAGIPSLAEVVREYVADATARLPHQHAALSQWGGLQALDAAFSDAIALAAEDRPGVLLHGDFNPGNIVRHGERWLLVDPKPLVGEPEFDLFPLIEQLGAPLNQPRPALALAHHLEKVSALVGCDPARTARWCTIRAALAVSWHLEDGRLAAAHAGLRELGLWRQLSGT